MNILILGGAGYIGQSISVQLVKNHGVLIYDKVDRNNGGNEIIYRKGDLSDTSAIVDIILENDVSTVIHFADSLFPGSSFDVFKSNINVNIGSNAELFIELAKLKIKLIYCSSGGTVYGQNDRIPLKESADCKPINLYGWQKLAIEHLIKTIGEQHGLRYLIMRPSNVYGPNQFYQRNQGIIPTILNRILKGEQIEIWGDGMNVRDYLLIDDFAELVEHLINAQTQQCTVNIGTGEGHSIVDLIKYCEDISDLKAYTKFMSRRTVDVEYNVLDISCLRSIVGGYKFTHLHNGIKMCWDKLS